VTEGDSPQGIECHKRKKGKDMNKKGGKSRIVKDIMAMGFTARKSEKALNAVIAHMKLGLRRGEPVEVPGGTLQSKIRRGKPRREAQRFGNVNTRKTRSQIIHYSGRRRVVKFTPDLALDLTPLPPLPLPETAEQIESRQLASYLLGKPADMAIMAALQQAAEFRRCMPGSLLRRLRDYKDRGWHFNNDLYELRSYLAAWYWL
jgi:nucleoid DNA-binding protein